MRLLVYIGFSAGAVLIVVAVMLVIDTFITDDRRANVQNTLDELAAEHEELTYARRRRDFVGGFARLYVDLRDGFFFRAPISLADVLPDAPDAWTVETYTSADGQRITGDPTVVGSLMGSSLETTLFRFEREARSHGLSAAATYAYGERRIAIRLKTDTDTLRTLRTGDQHEVDALLAAGAIPDGLRQLGTIDGIPVVQRAQFVSYPDGQRRPVAFRHFSFRIGHVVEVEILTNAPDADVARILYEFDMGLVQDALPRATERYEAGAGFVTPDGALPASELPQPTVAMQAYRALRNDPPANRDEYRALAYLAEGGAQDWHGLKRLERGRAFPVTDRLVSLLGPEPAGYQVQRDAQALLRQLGDTLSREERHLVAELANSGTHSQESLQSSPWWSEDLSDHVATLVAGLPDQ